MGVALARNYELNSKPLQAIAGLSALASRLHRESSDKASIPNAKQIQHQIQTKQQQPNTNEELQFIIIGKHNSKFL